MSYNLPHRGVLTDALVDYLREHPALADANILVGDGRPQPGAGWNGTPGKSDYIRSLLVSTRPAQPGSLDSLKSRHASWAVHYGLLVVGGDRSQADHGADVVRNAVVGFPASVGYAVEMGENSWRIADCHFEVLAPVTVDQRTTPPTWLVSDDLVLLLARKRT